MKKGILSNVLCLYFVLFFELKCLSENLKEK